MPRILARTLTLLLIAGTTFLAICETAQSQSFSVTDVALSTGFQDTTFGHYKRGRACIAADFDLDGFIDFYMGNPGDESYILRNVPGGGGTRGFVQGQVLVTGELTWGGVAFDYDNDGDYDLFVACGGNEGIGFNYLFRNDWILNGQPTGQLIFTDVTDEAGVAGIVPDGEDDPIRTSSGNAVIADYDRDGDDDIFVNGNFKFLPGHEELEGRNTLWRNNSDGTFTDVTVASGLGEYRAATRHSTFFDFDNDSDPDLYENVFNGCNVLWRNNGDGTFSDVTALMSAPGEDLSEPLRSFASASADFNNDGWEDLIVFMRGVDDGSLRPVNDPERYDCGCNECTTAPPTEAVTCDNIENYAEGHALFINRGGTQFKNAGHAAGLNADYLSTNGVMGCQIGDLNFDGIADVYVGNGGPDSGEHDRFYLSTGAFENDAPQYLNATSYIDFPAETPSGYEVSYPYRTHGVALVDFDNDGSIEIAVSNGGPAARPDSVREPDRLFKLDPGRDISYFKVRPVGNGQAVSMDAIGTRVSLRLRDDQGDEQTHYKTLFAGSSFNAQNGFVLHFLLAAGDSIEEMTVVWPNGMVSTVTEGLDVNTSIVVFYDEVVTGVQNPDLQPEAFRVEQNYPNPFNPSTVIEYSLGVAEHVTLKIYTMVGEEVTTLVDGIQDAGLKFATWDGRDSKGNQVATGMYMYRIKTSSSVEVRKMILMK